MIVQADQTVRLLDRVKLAIGQVAGRGTDRVDVRMRCHQRSVAQQPWPICDPRMTASDRLTIPIQVNGKLRTKLDVGADATREQIEGLARAQIAEWLQGKEPKKIVYVEKKLMNFVI